MADHQNHNLSIASANHLHAQGHITSAQRDTIHAAVRRQRKGKKSPRAPHSTFGSMAPARMPTQGSGHYMGSMPVGADEDQDGM